MKILHWILFRVVIVVVGLPVHVAFRLFRIGGYIHIEGAVPRMWKNGLLLVSNHPSYLEPLIHIFLFFEHFSRDPVKGFPWSTPDPRGMPPKTWPWFWIRWVYLMRIIDFNRTKRIHRGLATMIEVLKNGQPVIYFPESGTTERGKEFVTGTNGVRLRRLTSGAERIIGRTNCTVLPVWVTGPIGKSLNGMFGRRIRIKIGQPTQSITTTEDLERALITLGEQLEPAT